MYLNNNLLFVIQRFANTLVDCNAISLSLDSVRDKIIGTAPSE